MGFATTAAATARAAADDPYLEGFSFGWRDNRAIKAPPGRPALPGGAFLLREMGRQEQRSVARGRRLAVLADLVGQYGLAVLDPLRQACEELSADEPPLDVAVLGQFKSGKSSLLNTVLGEAVFPVGALPVTAVITCASAGQEQLVRVTHQDGSVEEVMVARIAEFVTEAGNSGNRRQVAVVDVFTPALGDWPGVRLVDTPGLGSVYAHNTAATQAWMPYVAVALV